MIEPIKLKGDEAPKDVQRWCVDKINEIIAHVNKPHSHPDPFQTLGGVPMDGPNSAVRKPSYKPKFNKNDFSDDMIEPGIRPFKDHPDSKKVGQD